MGIRNYLFSAAMSVAFFYSSVFHMRIWAQISYSCWQTSPWLQCKRPIAQVCKILQMSSVTQQAHAKRTCSSWIGCNTRPRSHSQEREDLVYRRVQSFHGQKKNARVKGAFWTGEKAAEQYQVLSLWLQTREPEGSSCGQKKFQSWRSQSGVGSGGHTLSIKMSLIALMGHKNAVLYSTLYLSMVTFMNATAHSDYGFRGAVCSAPTSLHICKYHSE